MEEKGLLQLKDITHYVNGTLDIQYQVGSKTIGRMCSQMGFEKTHTNKGIAIIVNPDLIQRLKKRPTIQHRHHTLLQ